MKNKLLIIIIVVFVWVSPVSSETDSDVLLIDTDLATVMMNSTFKIEGGDFSGTTFLIGKNIPDTQGEAYYVLVTAAHVVGSIPGDVAKLYLRKKTNEKYQQFPIEISIRKDGEQLWVKHPTADVAVMYITLPSQAYHSFLSETFLVDDKLLSEAELHPGDQLFALGFPFGISANDVGFPILRGGVVASYPITPTKLYPELLLDFEIRGGNSGGPVMFADKDRPLKGGKIRGEFEFIVGLVSQQKIMSEEIKTRYQTRRKEYLMNLAVVIPASIIKETIALLPARH